MEVLSPVTGDSVRSRHGDLRASQNEDCHLFFNCERVKEILKKMRKHFRSGFMAVSTDVSKCDRKKKKPKSILLHSKDPEESAN